jgi:hypothetical protein
MNTQEEIAMRKGTIVALGAIVMSVWILAIPARAAELPRTMWSELTFVDVADGREGEFRELVDAWLAPLVRHRLAERELFVWALYEVVYADAPYDHVLVRQAIDPAVLEPGPVPDARLEAAFPDGAGRGRGRAAAAREGLAELAGIHRVVARGLYANEDLHTDLERRDRPWLTATWLRTGSAGAAAYRQQMEAVWGPVLAAWVEQDGPAGVSGFRVAQPSAGILGHDHVWVAQYDAFPGMLLRGGLAEAFAAAHPDGDFAAARGTLDEIAPVVGSEVWRLVELARRPPPAPAEGP